MKRWFQQTSPAALVAVLMLAFPWSPLSRRD